MAYLGRFGELTDLRGMNLDAFWGADRGFWGSQGPKWRNFGDPTQFWVILGQNGHRLWGVVHGESAV